MFAGACGSPVWVGGEWNFTSDFSVTVRGPQYRELHFDLVERDDAPHPAALDLAFASRLEAKLDEELDCGREIVDQDADVFQPLDPHVLDGRIAVAIPLLVRTASVKPKVAVRF